MIVEKGHFHFAEKYWGEGKAPPAPPVPTALCKEDRTLPILQVLADVDVSFLKLMIITEHIKMMQMSYLYIWPMFLSRQLPHKSNSQVTCFGILQTLC